ncbi:hypothetical protein OIU77_015058 [Salix suchowensis]|uniref:Cation/H+ exchanger domain-containing protein n=1 Tax=Salix suchowensis TaxID=1278906 RepID=A0ABQ8ZZD6_9ROSI|nr:hypothetical protein OIU77_015058 [Salix suchowensis]
MATNTSNVTAALPKPMKATSNGAFQHENPLDFALPLLILQICLVVAFTRALAFLLKPLRQPRVIAEIIGGILLGPSAFRKKREISSHSVPSKKHDRPGHELDLRSIRRTGKKSLAIAGAGITLPFLLGIGTSFVLRSTISKGSAHAPFLVFMGVSLSITAFPVLARILAELKLLTTDVGRIAMSAAAVNDVVAWILLALAIALSGSNTSPLISLWVLLCGAGFLVFSIYVIKPLLELMARRSPEGEPVKEIYICITLLLVLASAFVTDTIGIHALFGAFVVGILVPKDGPFPGVLIEKIEDLVAGLFLPLYFASSGLKTNVATISGAQSWGLLVLVIATACFGKIVGTMCISLPEKEHLTRTVLSKRKDLDTELRLLACFHSSRNIPTTINLVECSRGTRKRGRLCVYAMHLMELSERSSAISMVHKARKNGLPFWNKKRDDRDQMVIAFEAYQQLSSVTIRPMTAISALNTIYEDICTSAHQKRAAMILLPFHKHQRVDGSLESLGQSLREVNQRVLRHSPCSVGILIDRGFGGTTQVSSSDVSYKIAVPFFGGRDDMEALAYGMRMAEHPGIMLTVLKVVPPSGKTLMTLEGQDTSMIKVENDKNSDSEADSELFFSEFIQHAAKKLQDSVSHEERLVESKADIITALKSMSKSNLFLVGRMPPVAPLLISTDTPELGPVGSFLASSDFSSTTSVLVIQHYNPNANLHPLVEEEENEDTDDGTDTPVLVDKY